MSIQQIGVLISPGLKGVRTALGRVVDFLADHVVRGRGVWRVVTTALAILLVVLAVLVAAAFIIGWFALGVLALPILTYFGWNWSLPILLGLPYISFRTAVGLNIITFVLLSLLRAIVIKN